MKAIIIEEERFAEICDLMKAKAQEIAERSRTPERLNWDETMWKNACNEVHQAIHCTFVRWAQSHGASCVK